MRLASARSNIMAAGLVAALLLAGLLATYGVGNSSEFLQRIIDMMQGSGSIGIAIFAMVQIVVAASGVLPASLVGLAAGAIYGVAWGFALASATTFTGAWIAFRVSRSIFRASVERLLSRRPRLARLDASLAQQNWRFVCLLRISPVMPFAAASYTLGLLSVSQRDYLIGTLAALPALLGYVCLGDLIRNGFSLEMRSAGVFRMVLLGAGGLATALLTLQVGRLANRILYCDEPPIMIVPD